MPNKSTLRSSTTPINRCQPPPTPPSFFRPNYPMLPYYHPHAYAPPMGYMPPPTSWHYTPTQPPMGYMPPPPPSPFWDNTYIYTQTLHQSSSPSQEYLKHKIRTQIEYYFSDDNLADDTYLKKEMDENGWVPIKLIAGFRRVLKLTTDIPLILESLKDSESVEVEVDKLRRRTTWKKWIKNEGKNLRASWTIHPP